MYIYINIYIYIYIYILWYDCIYSLHIYCIYDIWYVCVYVRFACIYMHTLVFNAYVFHEYLRFLFVLFSLRLCVCTRTMGIHTHTHIYIYIHTYIHTYMHKDHENTHISTYIHIHVHAFIHTYVHTHTHTDCTGSGCTRLSRVVRRCCCNPTGMYVHMYVRIQARMCMWLSFYIEVSFVPDLHTHNTYIHMNIHTYIWSGLFFHPRTYIQTHTCIHIHTHIHTILTNWFTHRDAYIHTLTGARRRAGPCILYVYLCSYMHVHVHMLEIVFDLSYWDVFLPRPTYIHTIYTWLQTHIHTYDMHTIRPTYIHTIHTWLHAYRTGSHT
jgi:hypothetical protein